jgi:DNA-damage-inducible protein J
MDSDVKNQLDDFCSKVGMNTATAINMFARAVLREKRLPFDVAAEIDPFCNESNLAYLKQLKHEVDNGLCELTPHELIEVGVDD